MQEPLGATRAEEKEEGEESQHPGRIQLSRGGVKALLDARCGQFAVLIEVASKAMRRLSVDERFLGAARNGQPHARPHAPDPRPSR